MLHDEIGRLPELYRVPIVLCHLEGLTHDVAAQRLGCPTGTVLSRLAAARERLRARLTRRGVTLSTGGLTALLARDLEAAAAHLRGLPSATAKVGAIGFCSGGRQTLLFACSSNKVDAAIDCWGGFIDRATPDAQTTPARPTPIITMVDRLSCPLFAVFGEEDQNPPVALADELRSRAQHAGKDVTTKVYKNAGHAFLADYRPSYREQPAFELWSDSVAFLDKQLKG